jgi:hypothetical protein
MDGAEMEGRLPACVDRWLAGYMHPCRMAGRMEGSMKEWMDACVNESVQDMANDQTDE